MTIEAEKTGKCPHCGVRVRFERTVTKLEGTPRGTPRRVQIVSPDSYDVNLAVCSCPACWKPILTLVSTDYGEGNQTVDALLWPEGAERPLPPEVEAEDADVARDFREAVAVFPKSKQASAALARRCLQQILVTKGGAKKNKNLSDQINQVLGSLPPLISANVDAIRQVGNFAAHPIKSTTTGEIVTVEEGEAEWLLDVLEELFHHYYVVPAEAEAKREELNKKLEDAGKPLLKKPPSSA